MSLSTSNNTAVLTLHYLGYSIENDVSACVFLVNVPEEKTVPKLAAPLLMEIQELVFKAKLAHIFVLELLLVLLLHGHS